MYQAHKSHCKWTKYNKHIQIDYHYNPIQYNGFDKLHHKYSNSLANDSVHSFIKDNITGIVNMGSKSSGSK